MINHDFEPYNLNSNNIFSTPEGVVPFTICYVPRNSDELTEKFGRFNKCVHNWFYLRIGKSLDKVIRLTTEEFEKLGLPRGRFNSNFVSGEYHIGEEETNVRVDLQGDDDFRFWVAEGLLGKYYGSSGLKLPKIRTIRKPSLKLYEKASIYGKKDLSGTRESEFELIGLLKDKRTPSSIEVPGRYLTSSAVIHSSRGKKPSRVRVMNYGYIWNRNKTYFQDPETEEFFVLPNEDPNPRAIRIFKRRGLVPPFKGIVGYDTLNKATFREEDKVKAIRENLYFDGTLRDMFVIMKNEGISFNPEIEDKYRL